MRLLLVRHAMPAFGPEAPPEAWDLSEQGHAGADSLRSVIPADALRVSSVEPKAQQTLAPSGRVVTDRRFNEVRRDEPYEGDFRTRRLAYVTGTDHAGWEPRDAVRRRFDEGIRFWLRADAPTLAVASHGMAMTLWLASIGLRDPGQFWSELRLPDVFDVDLASGNVTRVESPLLVQIT